MAFFLCVCSRRAAVRIDCLLLLLFTVAKLCANNVTKNKFPRAQLGNALPDGIYDARLGPVDSIATCVTCKLPANDCPGHMGRIELLLPLYNPLTFLNLRGLLDAKCFRCNSFRASTKDCDLFLELFDRLERGDLEGAMRLDPERPRHIVLWGEQRGALAVADLADAAADAAASERRHSKRKSTSAAAVSTPAPTATAELLARAARSNLTSINEYRALLEKRFFELFKKSAQRKCANCKAANPRVTKDPLRVKLFVTMSTASRTSNAKNNVLMPNAFVATPYAAAGDRSTTTVDPSEDEIIADQDDDVDDADEHSNNNKNNTYNSSNDDENDDSDDSDGGRARKKSNISASATSRLAIVAGDANEKAQFISPSEVRAHIALLWQQHAPLLNHLFFGSRLATTERPYEMFFLEVSFEF